MRRRRPHRVLSALALGVLLGGFLPGCGETPSGQTATPTASKTTTVSGTPALPAGPPTAAAPFTPIAGGPRIEFARLVHDFGVITDSQSHRTSFAFRNVGDQALDITDVKAACGCTVPVLAKRRYAPGEGGEIEVVFDPKGKMNKTNKKLTVKSTCVASPVTELEFTSMIQPLIAIDRMQKLGTIPLGVDYRHVVKARYRDPDLNIKSVSVNDENIHATVLNKGEVVESSDDGVVYGADIEVLVSRDKPWGLLFAKKLTVNVNGKWRPDAQAIDFTYDAFLMGNVFGRIHASQGIISLGPLKPNASYAKSVQLFSGDRKPFNITEARVVDSNLTGANVSVTGSGGRYEVSLVGNVARHRGQIRGAVEVLTDVPGEESLRIPFSGQVR